MNKCYVIGDLKEEIDEIERLVEQQREIDDDFLITYSGQVFSILCCS